MHSELPGEAGSEPAHPSSSRLVRGLLIAVGAAFVGLAALGALLPVLPTTPFLLVAAACFARSSPRFYGWLLRNRVFGPLIRNWRATRSIPRRAKITAIAMILAFGGSSLIWFLSAPVPRLLLGATLATLVIWLLRLPTTESLPSSPPDSRPV